jgi:hypothetical protein
VHQRRDLEDVTSNFVVHEERIIARLMDNRRSEVRPGRDSANNESLCKRRAHLFDIVDGLRTQFMTGRSTKQRFIPILAQHSNRQAQLGTDVPVRV